MNCTAFLDEHGDVGCAAANIDDGGAKFSFILCQNRFCARQLLQDHLLYAHLSPVDGIDQILVQCALAGHDVDIYIQPRTDTSPTGFWMPP